MIDFRGYGLNDPARVRRTRGSQNVFIALDREVVAVESDEVPAAVRRAWWKSRGRAVAEACRGA